MIAINILIVNRSVCTIKFVFICDLCVAPVRLVSPNDDDHYLFQSLLVETQHKQRGVSSISINWWEKQYFFCFFILRFVGDIAAASLWLSRMQWAFGEISANMSSKSCCISVLSAVCAAIGCNGRYCYHIKMRAVADFVVANRQFV